MAVCPSLVGLVRLCGADGVTAGLEKVYIIAFKDLAPVSGVAGTPIFTTATNGMISDIGLADDKNYVEIGLLKSTSGIDIKSTKNPQNGTAFYTVDFKIVLSDLTVENEAFVNSVFNQPVSIIAKTRTNKFLVLGLNGQFEVSEVTAGTGTAEGDLVGYNISFSGLSGRLVPSVDPALIPTLLEA